MPRMRTCRTSRCSSTSGCCSSASRPGGRWRRACSTTPASTATSSDASGAFPTATPSSVGSRRLPSRSSWPGAGQITGKAGPTSRSGRTAGAKPGRRAGLPSRLKPAREDQFRPLAGAGLEAQADAAGPVDPEVKLGEAAVVPLGLQAAAAGEVAGDGLVAVDVQAVAAQAQLHRLQAQHGSQLGRGLVPVEPGLARLELVVDFLIVVADGGHQAERLLAEPLGLGA